jgi:GTP-binding protein
MQIKDAKYLGSWEKSVEMPHKTLPEFAFIGRSNVGKSSLINCLVDRNELARTSSKPGKTQTLNLYNIDGWMQICDLPGYGYAKVSKTMRSKFSNMIRYYLKNRENLFALFVLVDLRIPPQQIDIEFINDCGNDEIPIVLVGTKSDKLKAVELEENVKAIETALLEYWEEIPPFIISSSLTQLGRAEIWHVIQDAVQASQQKR